MATGAHIGIMGFVAAALLLPAVTPAQAQTEGQKNERRENEIPRCSHRLGTVAVVEPERNWWSEYHLGSPEALIKIFVMRSGCFGLVDRGKGMAAIERERALAGGGELRQGSNMGKGQIKAADYVLVPDLVSQNRDSGGTNIGGMLGGFDRPRCRRDSRRYQHPEQDGRRRADAHRCALERAGSDGRRPCQEDRCRVQSWRRRRQLERLRRDGSRKLRQHGNRPGDYHGLFRRLTRVSSTRWAACPAQTDPAPRKPASNRQW